MKRFRSMPRAGSTNIPIIILFPFLVWSIPVGIKIFTSDEFLSDPLLLKLYICFGYSVFFVSLVVVLGLSLFLAYHNATKWAITQEGLDGLTPLFHMKRMIPWRRIQTVYICNLFGRNGYPIPGLRFSLDAEKDERIKDKKCGLVSGWPKWLDSTYVLSRPSKYVFIYFDPELERELRKHLPDIADIRQSPNRR